MLASMEVNQRENKEVKRAFGRLVKVLRAEDGISQKQAADRVGVERNFISLVERGEQEPRLTTIKGFADGFNLRLPELFERVEKMMEQD